MGDFNLDSTVAGDEQPIITERLNGGESEEDLQAFDVQLMRNAVDKFTEVSQEWTALYIEDQSLKPDYDNLNEHGTAYFWILMTLLYKRVEREGADQFCKIDTPFVWNFSTWLRIILNIAASVKSDPNSNDCLFSTSKLVGTYPPLTAMVGRYKFVATKEYSSISGKVKFCSKEYLRSACRFVCALRHGPPGIKMQCSHFCANRPQLCIHENHVAWESQQVNNSRTGCQVYGCAYLCKHLPKCVYTNLNGILLPCRNAEDDPVCHCEGEACRFSEVVKQETGVNLTSDAPPKPTGPIVDKAPMASSICKRGCGKKIEKDEIRIKTIVRDTPFLHVACFKSKNSNFNIDLIQVPAELKAAFESKWYAKEDAGDAQQENQETSISTIDPNLRYPTFAEFDELTQFLKLQPISDGSKQYARLLTKELNSNLLILNQDGILRVFIDTGTSQTSEWFRCEQCYKFSQQETDNKDKTWAKILINRGALSFIDAKHHPKCKGLTERVIVFTELERRCKKLVRDGFIGHIDAYERARMLAFHYDYLTNFNNDPELLEDGEPPSKRARVERNPNAKLNYDLSQPLEGFKGKKTGYQLMRR